MANRIILFAAAAGIAFAAGASALPLNQLPTDSSIVQVRTVCDEYGRCWQEIDPAEAIIGGVLGGLEGRSVHRDRDGDRDRSHRRLRNDDRNDAR